jgi:hypothetical protein
MHLPPEHNGFVHGPDDDARIASRRFPCEARIVMHAYLHERGALPAEFRHDFGVYQCAGG